MLYLEDYLEMIEHLPQELRDRFTEMRELDLAVQNNMDALEKRHNQIFSECRRSIVTTGEKPQNADEDFKEVLNEYFQVLEDADEKIQLANHVYDLVERYLRRLDTELHKFKCELEADNAGITELLEKRSLELDIPQPAQHSINSAAQAQKENRYRPRSEKRRDSSASAGHEKRIATGSTGLTVSSSLSAALSNTTDARHSTSGSAVAAQAASGNSLPSSANQSGVSYSLGHIGAGNAIAAAASQAIAATQQMQQGRRTASLKASYEAINTGVHGHELSIGRELAGAAHTALQAIQHDHANTKRQKKSVVNRKWTSQSSSNTSSVVNQIAAALPNVAAPSPPEDVAAEIPADVDATFDAEWGSDPNEPRYCVCNQISYGDMVACDNEDCPFEWFHYPCVNITSPPKGKWYCPQCTSSMKRRGRKN